MGVCVRKRERERKEKRVRKIEIFGNIRKNTMSVDIDVKWSSS